MVLFTLQALASPLGSSPDDHLRYARKALRADDFEGGRIHAKRALETPGAHDQEAGWLLGLSWQYDGQPVVALTHFRAAHHAQPEGSFLDPIELSIAEALAETGDHVSALKALRKTRRGRTFAIGEEERFDLDRAMWKLEIGSNQPRRMKRWTKRLLTVLHDVDHDLATWQQAKARTQLVDQWLAMADELDPTQPASEEVRALLVSRAREQLDETVEHGHDRFTLHQLHRLGRSFERLGDDVVSAFGAPVSLPEDERTKVESVWVKAHSFYDLAERHATRTARTAEARLYGDAAQFVEHKVDGL